MSNTLAGNGIHVYTPQDGTHLHNPANQFLEMFTASLQHSPQSAGNWLDKLTKGTTLDNDPQMNGIIDRLKAGAMPTDEDKAYLNRHAGTLGGFLQNAGTPGGP